MKRSKFIEILKKLIERERKLKEASTTANVPGYMTPKAFSGKGSKDGVPLDRRDSVASGSGYQKVNEDTNYGQPIKPLNATAYSYLRKNAAYLIGDSKDVIKAIKKQDDLETRKAIDSLYGSLIRLNHVAQGKEKRYVQEGKYHDYRNDESMTPKQKIGTSMREVRNALTELGKLIDMNVRLKNELNVDSRSYWKNTHKALQKISERLVKLANKVGKMQ